MFAAALATGNYHDDDRELGAGPTFDLFRLTDIDQAESHALALPGSFGEGALLRRLPPYRRLRERLNGFGYTFVPTSDLPLSDRVAPELRLLRALRERSIPYFPAGRAFQQLLSAAPFARFDDVGLVSICAHSTTAHEGAHALIWELALAREGSLEGQRLVEALIVGEGFAMAFEFWLALSLLRSESRSMPMFFAMNAAQNPFSLAAVEKDAPGTLSRLADLAAAEPGAVMKLFAAAGVIANVRPRARSLREPFIEFLGTFAGVDPAWVSEATTLVRAALSLEENFRTVTARTFFRFNDLEEHHRAFCERPLEAHFEPDAMLQRYLPLAITEVLDDGSA